MGVTGTPAQQGAFCSCCRHHRHNSRNTHMYSTSLHTTEPPCSIEKPWPRGCHTDTDTIANKPFRCHNKKNATHKPATAERQELRILPCFLVACLRLGRCAFFCSFQQSQPNHKKERHQASTMRNSNFFYVCRTLTSRAVGLFAFDLFGIFYCLMCVGCAMVLPRVACVGCAVLRL